jgi:predicted RNA-binding protein Jag
MQKILTVIFHKLFSEDVTIAFDVDNYRKRQEENVLTIAEQNMKEVEATKIRGPLPMSPYSAVRAHDDQDQRLRNLVTEHR